MKAQEGRPGEDLYEEAKAKLEGVFREAGWFREDGVVEMPDNRCHFITARKPET